MDNMEEKIAQGYAEFAGDTELADTAGLADDTAPFADLVQNAATQPEDHFDTSDINKKLRAFFDGKLSART